MPSGQLLFGVNKTLQSGALHNTNRTKIKRTLSSKVIVLFQKIFHFLDKWREDSLKYFVLLSVCLFAQSFLWKGP